MASVAGLSGKAATQGSLSNGLTNKIVGALLAADGNDLHPLSGSPAATTDDDVVPTALVRFHFRQAPLPAQILLEK